MLSDQIALAIAPYFDKIGPSHSEIGMLARREGLARFEPPGGAEGEQLGKMKRIRWLLTYARAAEPAAADRFAIALVSALRSHGSFDRDSDEFPGEPRFRLLQSAFAIEGYRLDPDGSLYQISLDALTGASLTAALEVYIRRALVGAADDPLLIGNAKDLIEAAARHAIEAATGSEYPKRANFEGTLFLAYDRLGLKPPTGETIASLSTDAREALAQALFLAGVASNRLRNQAGTGHGRPSIVQTGYTARLASQTSGLVARLLLDALAGLSGSVP